MMTRPRPSDINPDGVAEDIMNAIAKDAIAFSIAHVAKIHSECHWFPRAKDEEHANVLGIIITEAVRAFWMRRVEDDVADRL